MCTSFEPAAPVSYHATRLNSRIPRAPLRPRENNDIIIVTVVRRVHKLPSWLVPTEKYDFNLNSSDRSLMDFIAIGIRGAASEQPQTLVNSSVQRSQLHRDRFSFLKQRIDVRRWNELSLPPHLEWVVRRKNKKEHMKSLWLGRSCLKRDEMAIAHSNTQNCLKQHSSLNSDLGRNPERLPKTLEEIHLIQMFPLDLADLQ